MRGGCSAICWEMGKPGLGAAGRLWDTLPQLSSPQPPSFSPCSRQHSSCSTER